MLFFFRTAEVSHNKKPVFEKQLVVRAAAMGIQLASGADRAREALLVRQLKRLNIALKATRIAMKKRRLVNPDMARFLAAVVDARDHYVVEPCAICHARCATRTPCGHAVHATCMRQWAAVQPAASCPICRKSCAVPRAILAAPGAISA